MIFDTYQKMILQGTSWAGPCLRQVSLRTVGSSWETSPLCIYYPNRGFWNIFGRLTHKWISNVMLASQALIGLDIFQEWIVYGNILTGLLISYTYPKWPSSLGSPMISWSEMTFRCIKQLAAFDTLYNIPVDYYI